MEETFREHSIAEFFKKNRHMLGFSGKVRSLTTIVHEYVTNSLDACDEAGILPNITVELEELEKDKYRVVVKDNGPGIPEQYLGKALGKMLAGTKFHRFIQQRGQQGIGAAGCTMYAQLTTGKGVHVISSYNGRVVSCDIRIDFKTNKPIVENKVVKESNFHGLIVEGYFGEVKYDRGQYGVYEYLRRTAIANPHATITLKANGETYVFRRSVEEIPKKPKEVRPHPLGLRPHDLLDYAKATKQKTLENMFFKEFSRVSQAKIKELKQFVDLSKNPKELTWEEAEEIVKAIHKIKWMAPPLEGVIPIGREQIEKSLLNILKPEFLAVVERRPKIYRGGIPFIVEAAIAYGGEINNSMIMRFANRAPLLFDNSACAITEVVKGMDWRRYNLNKFEEEKVVVLVNISSVHIPYISAGKTAIANEEEVVAEIKNALQEAGRIIKGSISKKMRAGEIAKKRKAFMRYVEYLSSFLVELSKLEDEKVKEKIKEKLVEIINRKYSFSGERERAKDKKGEKEEVKENKEEKADLDELEKIKKILEEIENG